MMSYAMLHIKISIMHVDRVNNHPYIQFTQIDLYVKIYAYTFMHTYLRHICV